MLYTGLHKSLDKAKVEFKETVLRLGNFFFLSHIIAIQYAK